MKSPMKGLWAVKSAFPAALALAFVFSMVFFSVPGHSTHQGNLSCSIRTTCILDESDILHLSDGTNAHAELPYSSDYSYKVCCRDATGMNLILNYTGTHIVWLSNYTNAHIEQIYYDNYDYVAHIGANESGVGCYYRDVAGNCSAYNETCLFTMSDTTNAHIANCSAESAYNITACCQLTELPAAQLLKVGTDTLPDGPDSLMWDNVNDGQTDVYLNITGENISCRWNETDLDYSAMIANCSNVSGVSYTNITCNFGNLAQGGYTYFVACYDSVLDYGEVAEDNADVSFGVDWSGPTSVIQVASGTWYRDGFTLGVNTADPYSRVKNCYYDVTDDGTPTVNSAQWITNGDWYSAINSTPTITVGAAAQCSVQGANKCAITTWCNDWAGNIGS